MFTILPHTADVRLLVTAPNATELFSIALGGMSQIQRKNFCAAAQEKCNIRLHIDIHSRDITALLIDFLSEVLTLSHIHKAIFCNVHFLKFSETALTASIEGFNVNEFDEDIKAVTYHEADVIRNQDQHLETMIVFDI